MSAGPQTNNEAFPLRLAAQGETVRIVAVHGGRGINDRLAGMGLSIGAELEIVHNQDSGQLIVAFQGTRLFLGGGMAQRIYVCNLKGDSK